MRCSALSLSAHGNTFLEEGHWQASLAYRWLHSDRHFRGGHEEANRQRDGSEVINDVHTYDVSLTYALSRRFSLTFTVPWMDATRSSKYEHLGNTIANPRFTTRASGMGDVRFTGNVWFWDPATHPNGNFAFGLGIKAPTGDHMATDTFIRPAGPTLRFVDNSIQPGDGGWGVLLEAQGFHKIFTDTYAYVNGTYLINPRERVPQTGFSVWDAYMLRAGLTYAIWKKQGVAISLGGRLEGVPVQDWFGGSEGSRRPGYAVSIEPGITWTHKRLTVNVTAPVALERNRERNVSDIRTGRHGDAAFADYLLTASVAFRF